MKRRILSLLLALAVISTMIMAVPMTGYAADASDLTAISESTTLYMDDYTSNGTVKMSKNTVSSDGYIWNIGDGKVSTDKGGGTRTDGKSSTYFNSLGIKNKIAIKVNKGATVVIAGDSSKKNDRHYSVASTSSADGDIVKGEDQDGTDATKGITVPSNLITKDNTVLYISSLSSTDSSATDNYIGYIQVSYTSPVVTITEGSTANCNVGSTLDLNATANNFDGDVTYTWASDNESVATVSESGKTATVTGVAEGTSKITVTATDTTDSTKTASATCTVTVSVPTYTATVDTSVQNGTLSAGEGKTTQSYSVGGSSGDTVALNEELANNSAFTLENTLLKTTIGSAQPATSKDETSGNYSFYADSDFTNTYSSSKAHNYILTRKNSAADKGSTVLTYTAKMTGTVTVYLGIQGNKEYNFGSITTANAKEWYNTDGIHENTDVYELLTDSTWLYTTYTFDVTAGESYDMYTGGGTTRLFGVKFESDTVLTATGAEGTEFYVTATPNDGYTTSRVYLAADGQDDVEGTLQDDGTYKFSMPAYDSTIKAEFTASATYTFGNTDTDSGYYTDATSDSKVSVVRFLQSFTGSDIASYGFLIVDATGKVTNTESVDTDANNNVIASSENVDTMLANGGFYADVYGITDSDPQTYYAYPFVTFSDGTSVISDARITGTVDWETEVTYPED